MNPAKNQTVSATFRSRVAIVLLVASVLITGTVAYLSVNPQLLGDSMVVEGGTTLQVAYLEDPEGELTLQQVQQTDASDSELEQVHWRSGDGLRIGTSRSVWWVKIPTDQLLLTASNGRSKAEGTYFSILSPSVEKVEFYLPDSSEPDVSDPDRSEQDPTQPGYRLLEAGWGISHESHDDIGFSYPTFHLNQEISAGAYAYVRLSSPYTQNYTFRIYPDDEFTRIQRIQSSMITFFIGFLVAIGINNFIQYATLGNTANLYYGLYLFLMILYQGSVLGFSRLFLGSAAEVLVANIAPVGLAMVTSALLFFRSVLETKKNFPRAHQLSWVVLLLFSLTAVVFFAGFRFEGNLLTLMVSNLTAFLILITTYKAIRANFSQAKYLFGGWVIILLSSLVFNARAIGFLPNNELTSFIILFPAAVEAIFLSLSVSERMEQISSEKEHAVQQYQFAEGQVLTKESAFLQAQIRPHFLYNALNVIEALCYLDSRMAGELIQDLSKFLRHSFDFRNLKQYIDFEEELEFIQAYVKIEQARFRNKLNVTYDLEGTEGLKLPPLLLQPLVENAIQHGIRSLGSSGTVVIRVRELEHAYEINVEDDGIGMTEDRIQGALTKELGDRQSVGLANIQKRLKMFYGTELTIESAVGEGTRVTVVLPKKGDRAG